MVGDECGSVWSMARSGLIAVASLDGNAVDREDAVALGLHGSNHAQHLDGAILRAAEETVVEAAGYARAGSRTLAFLGEAHETEALAAAIGQPGADAATLAMHVVDQWDSGRGGQLQGEWSLMQWDEAARELIVAASPARRDQVFVAHRGARVAISPSITALADLPWVGRELDAGGLARGLARRELRNAAPDSTMLAAVTRLPPGAMLRVDAAGGQRIDRAPEPPPIVWEGGFDDAVAALEAELRAVVRTAMAPHRVIAAQLSGGLDSSLLACIAAQERRPDQELFFVCSVAPEGSGLPDEREFAAMVARQLGLPIHWVVPRDDADLFAPDWELVELSGGPSLHGAHHVALALQAAARDRGATLLLDGIAGEDHVSRQLRFRTWRTRARDTIEWAKRLRAARRPGSAQDNFHVRLAPDFLARLPADLQRHSPPRHNVAATPRSVTIGDPVLRSMPYAPTSIPFGELRYAMPFRARSLQRLAAGMPAAFTERDGMGRALARAMLKGRVPEEIRLRRSGLPHAPDHMPRLKRQAATLPERFARYRADGAGEVVDLEWLAAQAPRIAAHGPQSYDDVFELQLTAMLAEFLSGWRRRP